MTLEERNFWGPPLYTTTITDEIGKPVGIAYPDGTIVLCQPSNVGKTVTIDGKPVTIVWDGASPDPHGGSSKGRLLTADGPSYTIDSTVLFGQRIPTEAIPSEVKQSPPQGIGWNEPGTAETDSEEG